jgi:hypothetical protein
VSCIDLMIQSGLKGMAGLANWQTERVKRGRERVGTVQLADREGSFSPGLSGPVRSASAARLSSHIQSEVSISAFVIDRTSVQCRQRRLESFCIIAKRRKSPAFAGESYHL